MATADSSHLVHVILHHNEYLLSKPIDLTPSVLLKCACACDAA